MSRRTNGEGSVYKRADGRWGGAIYVYNRTGGRQRRQVYGRTKSEVIAKLSALRSRNDRRLPGDPVKTTVEQYATTWLSSIEAGSQVKQSTASNYCWILNRYVLPEIGSVRLTQLAPDHVSAMLENIAAREVSARTVQLCRAVLRIMLAQAEREEIVQRNVAALVKGPRIERQEVQPWTPTEAETFLKTAREHRLSALFSVGVALGLRRGELLGLRWEDVDFERQLLHVRQTVQRVYKVGMVVGPPKSARSRRTIPLPQVCIKALEKHRAEQRDERADAGDNWQDNGLVFCTRQGNYLEPRNMNRLFDLLIERAGVRRIRFHDLRHTCATLLLAQNVQPRVVMEVLGHSQLSMTTDLYGHVMPTSLRAAATAMDSAFKEQ